MEQQFANNYPEELKQGIDVSQYSNLLELLDDSIAKNNNKSAFSMMGKNTSYKEIDLHSIQLASYLQGLGLIKGDRVAIMTPNIIQFPIALFAIWRAGLIGVNVNPLYTPSEISKQLNDSGCKAIILLDVFAKNLQLSLEQIPELKHIILTKLGDHLGKVKGSLINYFAAKIKKVIPPYNLPTEITTNYTEALFYGSKNDFVPVKINPTDAALLQYTGGTTGISKGAVLSHANLVAGILQNDAWFNPALKPILDNEKQQLTVAVILPLYHVLSLIVMLLGFKLGGKSVLISNPRDFAGMMKTLSKNKINVFAGVNTLFNAFLAHKNFDKMNLKDLVLTVGGGASIQSIIAQRWFEKTNNSICEGYGLSECSPVLCCNTVHIKPKLNSIGFPYPNTDVILIDDNGKRITTPNTPGELAAKGPQVMAEYWNNPEETKLAFTSDGYFKTGDIAQFDEDGYFYIVDRKKEMILVSGFNVYPNEVEEVVSRLDGIKECAVIGLKDKKNSERVKLFVVANSDVTEQQIREHCAKYLTGYKRPQFIEFRDSLPKSNVGKILRRELRDEEQIA